MKYIAFSTKCKCCASISKTAKKVKCMYSCLTANELSTILKPAVYSEWESGEMLDTDRE